MDSHKYQPSRNAANVVARRLPSRLSCHWQSLQQQRPQLLGHCGKECGRHSVLGWLRRKGPDQGGQLPELVAQSRATAAVNVRSETIPIHPTVIRQSICRCRIFLGGWLRRKRSDNGQFHTRVEAAKTGVVGPCHALGSFLKSHPHSEFATIYFGSQQNQQ